MKKIFTLFAVVLMSLQLQAAMYIVGNIPFGDWKPSAGVEMTDNGGGIYTYTFTAEATGNIWFVFGDFLTPQNEDGSENWDLFNSTFRFGPTGGSDQEVAMNVETPTQRQGNGNGSYKAYFTAEESYTITFDNSNTAAPKFKIEGVAGEVTYESFTVAGTSDLLGVEWAPSATENDMTLQAGSETIYELKIANLAMTVEGDYKFKVAANHAWDFSWGLDGGSDNVVIVPEADGNYDVLILFDSETFIPSFELTPAGEGPAPIPGDVNGDGQVTISDANAVIAVILNGTDSVDAETLARADVNGDGQVTIADANAVISAILGTVAE